MRLYHTFLFLVVVAALASAQVKPVVDRVAAQNALFEEQYESDLRNFPERATAFGDYRYNDKLADRSLDAIANTTRPIRSIFPGSRRSPVLASLIRTSFPMTCWSASSSSALPTTT